MEMTKKNPQVKEQSKELRGWKVSLETLHAVNDECQRLTKIKGRQVTQAELAVEALRCYEEYRILHVEPHPRRKFDPRHSRWHTLLEEILTSGIRDYATAIIWNLKGWGTAARAKGAKISDFGDAEPPGETGGSKSG